MAIIEPAPSRIRPAQFTEIHDALYKYDILLFRNVTLTPEQQYALTKIILFPDSLLVRRSFVTSPSYQAFDPQSDTYGHGNHKTQSAKNSTLQPTLKTIPRSPQVQLIGNGIVTDHEGLGTVVLKHPSHTTFHKTRVSEEDEAKGYTRFNRWHMDAALYEYNPPRVSTLYGITVPKGDHQIVRYDDGSGDVLSVPLATTAFVSGKTMFELLPPELKSLAVRVSVRYAPHQFVWMASAGALPTGLGIENDGLERPIVGLPHWEESEIKTFPALWKNPVTGNLHFQVHPCGVQELIAPNAIDGAHIKDLAQVRALLYKMQRPAIAPQFVYPHNWQGNDLVLFHDRGLMRTVVGALRPDQVRIFHQCNLAAPDAPTGPNEDDVLRWA